MRTLRITQSTLAALGLASLLACGGGSSGPPPTPPPPPKTIADTLSYTNPSTGTYKLMKDSASTSTHLVLDLVGPASGSGHGVSLVLAIGGSGGVWSKVVASDGAFVQNTAFSLGQGTTMLVGKTGSGGSLQLGVFQKMRATSANPTPAGAVSLNQTLVKVAIDLSPSTPVNTNIPISITKGSVLMADGTLSALDASQVAAGTLLAN